MFTIKQFREHAKECRRLSRETRLQHVREQLLQLADTWDNLADDREENERNSPTQAPDR